MTDRTDPLVAVADAATAPPRANGELVFEDPWESRAFGLAVALHDAGVVDFEVFRSRLIEAIGDWEARHAHAAEGYRYYEHWLTALERTVLSAGLVEARSLAEAHDSVAREWSHDH